MTRTAGAGAMINVSSTNTRTFQFESDMEAYGASKAGHLGPTQALNVSLDRCGIWVNAISPAWIETRGCSQLRPEVHAQHQEGRVGRSERIARAAVLLTDPDACGFLTGQHIVIGSGMTVKMVYLD